MKFKEVKDGNGRKVYFLRCPACNESHAFNDTWQFNGDFDKPTVTPSLKVHWPYKKEDGSRVDNICHFFIKDGKMEFLSDCTHNMKGQTVDIPEYQED